MALESRPQARPPSPRVSCPAKSVRTGAWKTIPFETPPHWAARSPAEDRLPEAEWLAEGRTNVGATSFGQQQDCHCLDQLTPRVLFPNLTAHVPLSGRSPPCTARTAVWAAAFQLQTRILSQPHSLAVEPWPLPNLPPEAPLKASLSSTLWQIKPEARGHSIGHGSACWGPTGSRQSLVTSSIQKMAIAHLHQHLLTTTHTPGPERRMPHTPRPQPSHRTIPQALPCCPPHPRQIPSLHPDHRATP